MPDELAVTEAADAARLYADALAALRASLRRVLEEAPVEDLRLLVDDMAQVLAQRVGTWAPFIHAAVGGIHQALGRASALARPIPPSPVFSPAPRVRPPDFKDAPQPQHPPEP